MLSPAPEGAAERFAQGMPTGSSTDWTVQLLKGVPEAIKDQVGWGCPGQGAVDA